MRFKRENFVKSLAEKVTSLSYTAKPMYGTKINPVGNLSNWTKVPHQAESTFSLRAGK